MYSKTDEIEQIHESSVNRALEVIRNRIDSLGISEPSLQKQGKNKSEAQEVLGKCQSMTSDQGALKDM